MRLTGSAKPGRAMMQSAFLINQRSNSKLSRRPGPFNLDKLREGFWDYLPLAGFVSVLLMIEMALILGSRHFGLEVMATDAACRTYNILVAEGRKVAAALLLIEK